jgi:hypothetical protein
VNPFDGQVIYMTDVDQTAVWDGSQWTVLAPIAGGRNKIINGDMRIAQRGTATITGSASAQYPVDRWIVYNGTGTVTFAQSAIAPTGYTNSLNATVTATGSYGASGYTEFGQMVEGFNCQDLAWGTASAKQITVSFWVRSSVTGTYNVAFQNNAQNRSYITSFTINTVNTWEYKTIQIPGDTSGTWTVNSTSGLRIWFNLGMGTNYDTTGNTWTAGNLGSTAGTVDFAANSGATFYITGVQIEVGAVATPFEFEDFGTTLTKCQRYYCRVYSAYLGTGMAFSTTSSIVNVFFPTTMRVAPSALETTGVAANYFQVISNTGTQVCNAVPAHNNPSTDYCAVTAGSASTGLVQGNATFILAANGSVYFGFSAEL